jgi:hypothetical protein
MPHRSFKSYSTPFYLQPLPLTSFPPTNGSTFSGIITVSGWSQKRKIVQYGAGLFKCAKWQQQLGRVWYTSVCAFLVWKGTHSRRSDPVVAGAPFFSKFQRGAWRGECARGGVCKVTPHPAAIHQSIDCPLYLIFYFLFTLVRPTWLMFVVEDRLLGG